MSGPSLERHLGSTGEIRAPIHEAPGKPMKGPQRVSVQLAGSRVVTRNPEENRGIKAGHFVGPMRKTREYARGSYAFADKTTDELNQKIEGLKHLRERVKSAQPQNFFATILRYLGFSDAHDQALAKIDESINSLSAEAQRREKEIAKLNAKNESLQRKIQDLTPELDKLKLAIESDSSSIYQGRALKCENALAHFQEEEAGLLNEREQWQGVFSTARSDLATAQQALLVARNDFHSQRQAQRKVAIAEERLSEARKSMDQINTRLDAIAMEKHGLNAELNALRQQTGRIQEKHERMHQITEEMAQAQAQISANNLLIAQTRGDAQIAF